MEAWGGSGDPLGELLEAFGRQDGPDFKKARKSERFEHPQGPRWAAKIGPKRHLEAFFCVKKHVQKQYLKKHRK